MNVNKKNQLDIQLCVKYKVFILSVILVMLCPIKASAILRAELDTVVVSANRLEQDSYKVAGNVTVITREQIENSSAQSIPEILKEAQGVYVYDNSTLKSTTVDIRGFGDTATRNVLVLVNDRRVNLVSLSGPDLVQVPVEAVERIEIIRGAGSVLYGDNAVGGVINIITKKGAGDISGKIGGFYGSYDTQGGNFEVSGEEKGLSYYLYSKYLDKRGYRQNSDELLKDHNARIGYTFNENVSMDIEVGVHQDTVDLPGGLDQTELAALGRRGSADESNVITTNDKYYRMTLDIVPWAKEFYIGDFVVSYDYRERDTFDSFGSSNFNTDRMLVTHGIQGKYIYDHTIFEKEVNFVTGVDYYEHENDILGSGSNSDDLTISKDEIGFYTFMQFELLDDLFVNGGTRYYKADYTFNQRNVVTFEEQDPDEWVSMGGLKYEYAKGSNIHFNYQQTFRFLATDEWYSSFSGLNTNIDQQTGEQFEAGIKHNFRDKIVLNVTPYYIRNKNEIYFNPTGGSFGFGANENYDKTERLGVELGARFDLLEFIDCDFFDQLEFSSNYTWQNPEFAEGANDGNDIPLVPRQMASSSLLMRFMEYFNLSFTGRYIGSRFILNDVANEIAPAKPYYVMDAKLAYRRKYLELWAAVNNLFDEQYSSFDAKKTLTLKDIYPAPERNFLFGVNVKF